MESSWHRDRTAVKVLEWVLLNSAQMAKSLGIFASLRPGHGTWTERSLPRRELKAKQSQVYCTVLKENNSGEFTPFPPTEKSDFDWS